jgi:hypothetical protein
MSIAITAIQITTAKNAIHFSSGFKGVAGISITFTNFYFNYGSVFNHRSATHFKQLHVCKIVI